MVSKKVGNLKKGDRVILAYGDQNGDLAGCRDFNKLIQHIFNNSSYHAWEAEVVSFRGKDPTIVCLNVFGWETEIGDTYAHEIIGWMEPSSGTWQPIEHTKKQLDMLKTVQSMGM